MKRRMYFVLPNCVAAKETENDLLLAKIDNHNIHFMAHDSVDLGDLNRANFLQRSDLIHGWEMGLVVGGLTGALLGMTLLQFGVFAGMSLGAVLLIALAGAFMGAWFSGLVAISVPNSRLKPFAADLDAGRVLLMVDVCPARVREIRKLMQKRHPEASDGSVDSQLPAFP